MDTDTLSVSDSKVMTNRQHLATLATVSAVGSIAWRHELAWRQLSILWGLPIAQISNASVSNLENIAALSTVLESDSDVYHLNNSKLLGLAKILFLDRIKVTPTPSRRLSAERCEYYSNDEEFCHVLRIEGNHNLTQGLPDSITIYGNSPVVTPVEVNDSLEVLLSLNNVPVIAVQSNDLLIGVDPWQLGAPSCPMLYKILSNWLFQVAGLKHSIAKPHAIIRLDDLPTTAEQANRRPSTASFDKRQGRVIKKLRTFAEREKIKFTLMYSSHLDDDDSDQSKVSTMMVKSIEEMRKGVSRGVFEIGSHGMVHLRGNPSINPRLDPREFLDLDEKHTRVHLSKCDAEIQRLFMTKPRCFVAPAWGYRAGVTKKVAGDLYPVIVDSSQHMEDGSCDVLMGSNTEAEYFNATETFRVSERVLTYSDWRFWRCYAVAGIPVHYMQHTDGNWQALRHFVRRQHSNKSLSLAGLRATLLRIGDDTNETILNRSISVWLLSCLLMLLNPALSIVFWKALTANSIYSFLRAMKRAGYGFQTLSEFSNSGRDCNRVASRE